MNWRFWRKREPEQRQTAQGYTAALTAALQAGAEGGVPIPPRSLPPPWRLPAGCTGDVWVRPWDGCR